MASSSTPELSLEERITEMQNELDRVKELVKEQTKLMLSLDNVGENRWDSLNQELKSIREDLTSEVEVNFKDIANVIGGMRHRINKLEVQVGKLTKAWPKDSKLLEKSEDD
jgi:dsDNA-specific endonuclease/ATPase MutS2